MVDDSSFEAPYTEKGFMSYFAIWSNYPRVNMNDMKIEKSSRNVAVRPYCIYFNGF